MVKLAQGYFRKTVFQSIRFFKHPRKLKNSPVRRWFSRHFLNKRVWKPTQHTFAAGLAIGMVIMMQLAPGQMFIAAILAAVFRVNIPIAIIACWISNPFTFVPFGWAQKKVGDWAMPLLPDMLRGWIEGGVHWLVYHIKDLPDWLRKTIGDEILAKGPGFISIMYLGGMIIGLALGIASYPLAWVVWEGFARYNEKRKTRFEPLPEDAPKPKA
jgi:uncharacterized protein (DUF2062 family)